MVHTHREFDVRRLGPSTGNNALDVLRALDIRLPPFWLQQRDDRPGLPILVSPRARRKDKRVLAGLSAAGGVEEQEQGPRKVSIVLGRHAFV